jgi:hypothetical protein
MVHFMAAEIDFLFSETSIPTLKGDSNSVGGRLTQSTAWKPSQLTTCSLSPADKSPVTLSPV